VDALPAEVRQELVMSTAELDGHAVTTHRLRAASRPEPLLDAMRARWRAEGVPFVESRFGEWRILSVRDANGYRTVQLRGTPSGSEGLVSRWHRPGIRPSASNDPVTLAEPPPLRWLPERATLIRRIEHRDPGRDAASFVAVAGLPPAQVASHIRERAAAEGFVDDPAAGLPASAAAWYRGGDGAAGQAIALRRGREEVIATVSEHREGAAIVMHWGASR
jgi:hypothetical protein